MDGWVAAKANRAKKAASGNGNKQQTIFVLSLCLSHVSLTLSSYLLLSSPLLLPSSHHPCLSPLSLFVSVSFLFFHLSSTSSYYSVSPFSFLFSVSLVSFFSFFQKRRIPIVAL